MIQIVSILILFTLTVSLEAVLWYLLKWAVKKRVNTQLSINRNNNFTNDLFLRGLIILWILLASAILIIAIELSGKVIPSNDSNTKYGNEKEVI